MGYDERPQQPPIHQFGGLNVRDCELGLPDNDSPYMINVDLHPEGSLRKRMGMSALETPDDETKIEMLAWLNQPEASRSWIYAIAGGKIYRTSDLTAWAWEEPALPLTGGAATPYTLPTQKSWGRENSRYLDGSTERPSVLYIPRSNAAPIMAFGLASTASDLKVLPAASYGPVSYGYPIDDGQYFKGWGSNHWPTHMRLLGIGKNMRMYAWGFADDPNRVDYSAINMPYHFMRETMTAGGVATSATDGGWFYSRPGDGDGVIAIVDMFTYTVIFKKHRTLIYSGDPGDTDWTVAADFPVGCASDRAWKKVGNDILFWSEDGLRSLSAVQEYGDLAQADLSFKISTIVRSIVPGSHERICCYHDITNARVVWFVPLSGDAHNDSAFVYYYNSHKWTKWVGDLCSMMDVATIRPTSVEAERIVGGTFDSGIVLLDSGYSDLGEDVTSVYYTTWLNYGSISDAERALWLDVFFGNAGTDVEIAYQTDLREDWISVDRVVKSFGSSGSVWGTFKWGEKVWGMPGRAHKRFEINGLFGLIRFRFSKTGKGGFEVMGFRPEIRMKGPRA